MQLPQFYQKICQFQKNQKKALKIGTDFNKNWDNDLQLALEMTSNLAKEFYHVDESRRSFESILYGPYRRQRPKVPWMVQSGHFHSTILSRTVHFRSKRPSSFHDSDRALFNFSFFIPNIVRFQSFEAFSLIAVHCDPRPFTVIHSLWTWKKISWNPNKEKPSTWYNL